MGDMVSRVDSIKARVDAKDGCFAPDLTRPTVTVLAAKFGECTIPYLKKMSAKVKDSC